MQGMGRPSTTTTPPPSGGEKGKKMKKAQPAGHVVRTYTAEEAARPDAVEAVGRAIVDAAAPSAERQAVDAWRAAMLAAAPKAPKWASSWGLIGLAAGVGLDPATAAGLTRGRLRSEIKRAACARIDDADLWQALWGLAAGVGDDRKKAAKALYTAFCEAADVEVLKGQTAAAMRKGLTRGGQAAGVLPDRRAAEAARRRDAAILRAADDAEAVLRAAGVSDPAVIAAGRAAARDKAASAWDKRHTKAP